MTKSFTVLVPDLLHVSLQRHPNLLHLVKVTQAIKLMNLMLPKCGFKLFLTIRLTYLFNTCKVHQLVGIRRSHLLLQMLFLKLTDLHQLPHHHCRHSLPHSQDPGIQKVNRKIPALASFAFWKKSGKLGASKERGWTHRDVIWKSQWRRSLLWPRRTTSLYLWLLRRLWRRSSRRTITVTSTTVKPILTTRMTFGDWLIDEKIICDECNQCDQMTRLCLQYLAIFSNEICPKANKLCQIELLYPKPNKP